MTDIKHLLFSLLRASMGLESALPDSLSAKEAETLFALAKTHDLSHLVAFALDQKKISVEEPFGKSLAEKYFAAVYRCEQMKHALKEISSVLEQEKIPYIPLKGSVLRSFYPEEWMRTSCDIDILVHENDLTNAINVLVSKLGYKTDSERNYHDVSLHSPSGIHLELHFNIQENMDNIDRLLSKVWDYTELDAEKGFQYHPINEFFVFHHIAHMSYHFVHGGCGIKPFIDLHIMKSKMSYNDETVIAYCKQCGIEKFYHCIHHITDVWFGDKQHTPISSQIEDYILRGGVYGSLENNVAISQSRHGGKVKSVLSRLFMPYEALKNYYPILEKHKWLMPFMYVRRCLRIFFKGRFKRSLRELQTNHTVSNHQVSIMNDFLEKLGLKNC